MAASAVPNSYKDKHGTYYVRYVFDRETRNRIQFLPRDFRSSLRTKNRRIALLRVRWFVFQIDTVVEHIRAMDDTEEQKHIYYQQAAMLRQQLEPAEHTLPVETALELDEKVNRLMSADKISSKLDEYADELEIGALSVLTVAEKQIEALQRMAESRVQSSSTIDANLAGIEERASARATRLTSEVAEHRCRSKNLRRVAEKLKAEIPMTAMSNVKRAMNSTLNQKYTDKLSKVAADYFDYKEDSIVKLKDFRDMQRKVIRFIELLNDPRVCDITAIQVNAARKDARKLPREQGKAKGLNAQVMLGLGLEARSLTTTNNQLAAVKSFFAWAKHNMRIEHDFSPLIKDYEAIYEREYSQRRSWEIEELRAIFNSYIYRYDKSVLSKKHANECIGYGRFWIPLIGLYTGARLEEICCLRAVDITFIDDVWCFDMREFDEEGRPTKKNASSVRVFPVHAKLQQLGLVQYAQDRLNNNEKMLFDEVYAEGKWSHSFSKWFGGTFKKRIGIPAGGNDTVFHSFRSNVIDEFSEAGVAESEYSRITGHSTGGTARNTYAHKGKKIFPPSKLVDIVNAVEYKGLDLSHISFEGFVSKYMKIKRKARTRKKRVNE